METIWTHCSTFLCSSFFNSSIKCFSSSESTQTPFLRKYEGDISIISPGMNLATSRTLATWNCITWMFRLRENDNKLKSGSNQTAYWCFLSFLTVSIKKMPKVTVSFEWPRMKSIESPTFKVVPARSIDVAIVQFNIGDVIYVVWTSGALELCFGYEYGENVQIPNRKFRSLLVVPRKRQGPEREQWIQRL